MRPHRLILALALLSGPAVAQEFGRDATRSVVTVIDADGRSKRVVFDSPRRFDAPNWSPDGSSLLLNSGGKLWRIPAIGGQEPRSIPIGSAWVDINHGISPDGKTLAITNGPISLLPADGGEPRPVMAASPSYFQGWSPDGKTLVYTANRGRGYENFAIDAAGGAERQITPGKGFSECPDYSPDGRWIYFNSDRSGNSDLWRVPATSSGDAKAERVTGDDREDWSPRPSPDGKWLIFLSYQKKTGGHPSDRDVTIRRMPLPGAKVEPGKVEDVVRFVGGHGSIGQRPWSPDGRRFAYVSYEPPPPTVRIVFFTPSDLAMPAGAGARLTKIADSAEKFLFEGIKRWNYPPAARGLFRREADGSVEVLQVKGDSPISSGKYARPDYAGDVIQRATRQYRVAGDGHIWWIFIYVGDRPTRFNDWRGQGNPRDGGWAMVNYDTIPGEVRPEIGLGEGFNARYFLKGTVHELGHAFGLHHVGPDLALGLGNSLMGPNNSVYAERKYPKADQVYLTESSAARLWKHPIFSGTAKGRALQPSVNLVDYKPRFSRSDGRVTISGKLVSDQHAHSVVVVDDLGNPTDDYWHRGHTARIAADGTFRVAIDKPAKVDGHYRIVFCFENGIVTGDGAGVTFDDLGDIRKSYRFRDGSYLFGD